MLPLEGITVVSIEQAVAAPFATRQLADLGARVIKVERPDGGDFARSYDATVNGLSSYFVWLNRSKQSLTLDLKRPEALDVLQRLIARADVFVQNLAPGAADRIGIGTSTLRARHRSLIACSVSGYGATGPYAAKKAYDLLIQSEVGLISITGTPEAPAKVGISVADIAAGMYAYSAILAALFARGRTGEGAAIEVSLFDALAEWMNAPAYYTRYGGAAPGRTGASHASIAPYGPFRTADGRDVYLGIQNAREWQRFCSEVLKRPGMAQDDRFLTNASRVQNRSALHEQIDQVVGQLIADALIARLEAAQIAYARMNSVADFLEHPQLTARHRWHDIDSPAGPIRALEPPASISGVEAVMGPVPSLGQHDDAILEELGFDAATIAEWRKEKVIRWQ
jgi:itaconate CoA-transferase